MRKGIAVGILWVILGLWAGMPQVLAQTFRFKVAEQGIYKISESQAKALGFAGLTELSIYGFPGMLPQKLDSSQLQLQEIPALEQEGQLFFFLSGPHTIAYTPEGLTYSHHLFSDSLSFLVGRSPSPSRIASSSADAQEASPGQIWYRFTTYKTEKTNVLNSGRAWYSDPIRQGQSLNINLSLQSSAEAPWLLFGKLMAQSPSSSTMRVLEGNNLLGELAFDPIPSSTYGVKGREQAFAWQLAPRGPLAQLRFTFQGTGSDAGYLDYVAVGVPLSNSVISEGVLESAATARLALPSSLQAWEVSDFFVPRALAPGSGRSAVGKKWAIFSPEKVPEIRDFQNASLQLRTQTDPPELLIIAPQALLSSANKLRNHKLSLGIEAKVVTPEEIYESFGYGNADLSAIRNFIAYNYHRHNTLSNVLILGKGTFDYKGKLGGRPNLVPIYTSRESLNPLTSFSSDDYFGLIGFGQGEWEESRDGDEALQIGIGRLPAINYAEANEMVEKIIRYETRPHRTPKSSAVSLLVDDGDNNIHLRDAESHSAYLTENHPDFLQNKLYLDRFEQEKSGSSQRSAQAKSALKKTLDEGTLILNFIGHGNETTLMAEEIFRVEDLADWGRQEQLALWITATCEFGRHDSPFARSAAEELLSAREKGAVALLTTGRPVFSSVNFSLNKAFIEEVFRKKDGSHQDLGEIYRQTKNRSLNGPLNRNFSLLGDPSLRLALPDLGVRVTSIEDSKSGSPADTLKALQEITLHAEILDPLTGAIQAGFKGSYQLELRDKAVQTSTLGDESSPYEFEEETVLLFRGTGTVESGKLVARFLIPEGINPKYGKGSLRIRAWDSRSGMQAMGADLPVIGGQAAESTDKTGPSILLLINGQSAEPLVFPTKNLEIKGLLSDPSGINVSSFTPAQALSIQANGQAPVILNEYFIATDGGYANGYFDTYLGGLEEGANTITVRAWDNAGNETVQTFSVRVEGSRSIRILDHMAFPNPATTETHFEVAHNRPGENLSLSLAAYSLSGQILFQETFRFQNAERSIKDLYWSFLQNQTKYPAKGTYIYKLTLQSESDFTSDSVSGKLVIQ
ncbi:type IX secretion system sortase PorU [Algoriphagus sp. H41]|uniref:Type IX secretion system sortase PorU n=1 Tax=Algoriphagus oliviformis TaxID=2811231 RepID=A0ABS3C7N3_9BACT|nr:type IX secretion system sortase PorU [Algoriphagus oliviformis]MBN7811629.1 type IX secretion system sortase PorU [Algoriphagus oliviformis]